MNTEEKKQILPFIKQDEESDILKRMKSFGLKSIRKLGAGGFGCVYKAHYMKNSKNGKLGQYYAVKVVKKYTKTIKYVEAERDLLEKASHDGQEFIISMVNYHCDSSLYAFFVLEHMYCDLDFIIKKLPLSESSVRFYAEEMIVAIEYLHSNGVIHKDIKPANVLIGFDGHIKLSDFGFCETTSESKIPSGTKQYKAPEVHLMKKHGKEVDWWSMGVTIYKMIYRKLPFIANKNESVYRVIMKGKIDFTNRLVSSQIIDLIKNFLSPYKRKRIGWKGSASIKKHPFFKKTSWVNVLKRSKVPPFIPRKEEDLHQDKATNLTL